MKDIFNINMRSLTFPKVLPIIGVILSMFFWIADSIIDIVFFGGDKSVFDSIVAPEKVELWMRFLVVILLVGFSYYAKYMLTLQTKAASELNQYKNKLEKLVKERTKELNFKNEQMRNEIETRIKAEKKLERLATTDPLTTLYNRRKFNQVLKVEIERNKRYNRGLSLMLCDIDYFKKINDKHGHDVGDDVLKEIATILKGALRKTDLIARWGGEEFIFLLPNTQADQAMEIANKIRQLIEASEFPLVNKITASLGVAFLGVGDDELELVKRADTALYKAKEKGRNLVEISPIGESL